MGRGNAVIWGKISLTSETETMASLVKILKSEIIDKIGYPESDKEKMTEEEEKKLKELESELKTEEQKEKENGAEDKKPVFVGRQQPPKLN